MRFNGSEKKITELVKKINNPSIPVYPLAKGKATFKTPSSRTLALPCFEYGIQFIVLAFFLQVVGIQPRDENTHLEGEELA